MIRAYGVPLSLMNLLHDKLRLATALAGISFAVLLMFMEIGFLNGLNDAPAELLGRLRCDLLIASPAKYTMAVTAPFARRRVLQARGVEGVAGAWPFYLDFEMPSWKDLVGRTTQPIRVLAWDTDVDLVDIPEVARDAQALRRELPIPVLMDRKSSDSYGPCYPGLRAELNGRAVEVVDTFDLGTDFAIQGTVILHEKNYAKVFPQPEVARAGHVRTELGLVQVAPGHDVLAVQAALQAALGPDVAVYTRPEFFELEMRYWNEIAPLGGIFGLGVAIGFVVGVMICYQILYTEVVDYLDQYATLKAIGYPDRSVISVVVEEALALSLLGFVVGQLLSVLLYRGLAAYTGLPMRFTPGRVALVFVLTTVMCLVSGLIAVRRVARADPADVF